MATFAGKYYSDKSNGSMAAKVDLTPAALRITYQDSRQTVPKTLYWQVHRLIIDKEPPAGVTILRYGAFPGQTLELAQPDFLPVFEKYYNPISADLPPASEKTEPSKQGLGIIYLFFFALLALVPITYFFLLPLFADVVSQRLPLVYEQKLGQIISKKLIQADQIDSLKTKNLKAFTRQLNLGDYPNLTIWVIKNKIPNAFAIPGGTIVVHDGMLPLLQKPEELAALLGHEYGHVALRHSLRTLFRTVSGFALISFVFGDVSALTTLILQNAHTFKSLAYSREFEKEADELGLKILMHNKVNPFGMVKLFQHLQQQQPKQDQDSEYLSSHPLLSSRMAHIKKLISQSPYQELQPDSLNFYFKQLKQTQH